MRSFSLLVLVSSVAIADPVVPCGAGLCVGTTPQDVTLGVTIMETRGPLPDGGRAILQPVLPGASLVLQGVQPSGDGGSAALPDVIIGSRNTHTGAGSFISFRNGANGAELWGMTPGGPTAAAQQMGFIDAGTELANTLRVKTALISDGTATLQGTTTTTLTTSGNVNLTGAALLINSSPFEYKLAPTLTGFCTSPSVTWAGTGTAVFQIDVGTSCTGISTGTINFTTATNGWECHCTNTTATATRNIDQGAGTATTVVITNYSRTLGTAADWADGDDVRCMCGGG